MTRILLFSLVAFIGTFSTYRAQSPGNALDFDGTNDQVICPLPAVFNNIANNDFTMEAWIYPTASTFTRIIFAQQSTTNNANISFSTGNTIYFYVVDGGTTYSIQTSSTLPLNTWSHVAARWTAATNTPEVLFNGILQPGAGGGGTSTGTSGQMVLGSRPGGAQYFDGIIDEVRIWNTARTDCDVAANVNAALTGTETGLVAYYKFDHGVAGGTNTTVTTLTDLAGTNNGTVTNFALTGTTSNWVASGATININGHQPGSYNINDTAYVCAGESYVFPDGFTANNIVSQISHTSNLLSSASCDSNIHRTVLVSPSYDLKDTVEVCSGGSYTFHDGTVQDNIIAQVSHTSNLQSAFSCDSVIATTVNVKTVNTTVTQSGAELTALVSGVNYQWLDCNDGFAPLSGETSAIFTATANGDYAVEITEAGCVDTSACIAVTTIGVDELWSAGIKVYPNPVTDRFSVNFGNLCEVIEAEIRDVDGRLVKKMTYRNVSIIETDLSGASGVYYMTLRAGERSGVVRIVKK